MCNLFHMTPKGDVERYIGRLERTLFLDDYVAGTVGPFQSAIFLRQGSSSGDLVGELGQWGMIRPGQSTRIDRIPQKVEPGKKPRAPVARSTNNARIEGIDKKPTYSHAWRHGKRCLVPANWYAEPNWETGKNIWWHLKRADGLPWFIAGLWDEWVDPGTGEVVPNFTMLTCNCTGHPLLGRLHRPEVDLKTRQVLPPEQQDKRSLIHVDPQDWETWLQGSVDDALALIKPQGMDVFDLADAKRTDEALRTG